MKSIIRTLRHAAAAAVLLVVAATTASAQSDILLQLRSGSPAGDRFRVDSAGGVVAIGQLGIGIIPASGQGFRMMWHPFKAAFRVGGASVAGEFDESNIGFYSIASGQENIARAIYSTAMGYRNDVQESATAGTALGYQNIIHGANPLYGSYGFAAGLNNDVWDLAGVAIGNNNTSSGDAAIAIGFNTTADANYSVAIGYRASTNGYQGAMTLADASTTDSLEASATNRFHARYAGGYFLYTNATTTTGVYINGGGSSWNVVSDRNRKEDFLGIDGEDLLGRLENVPVTRWRYIDEENRAVSHIGPMAQDWNAAFALSDDPLTINMSDFDGVNLAAIQALTDRTDALRADVAERDTRIGSLESRVAQLESENAALEARLRRLEELLTPDE